MLRPATDETPSGFYIFQFGGQKYELLAGWRENYDDS